VNQARERACHPIDSFTEIAMSPSSLPGLVGLALSATFVASASADVLIDDFSTGHYRSPPVKSGGQRSQQSGAGIVGGTRTVFLTMCDPADCAVQNPYNQGVSYAIARSRTPTRPSVFLQNVPVYAYSRIDINYGAAPAVLDLDLSAADRVRVDLTGLTETLNFNVMLFDNSGFKYYQGGCNAAPYNGFFSLEFPFDRMAKPAGPIDLHHITLIALIFQPSSFIGGVEFGMSGVTATATPLAGATICA
jgi:hypothetical protein